MNEPRYKINAATAAALWALSNGTCYAPGCDTPVVREVRPGVYRKNVQIAHIIGVRPGSARYQEIPRDERDSFSNLILLCLAHHADVDDTRFADTLYPVEVLRRWKEEREGSDGGLLGPLSIPDEETLFERLAQFFEPPIERLERIAKELQRTGRLNAESVYELQQVVGVLRDHPPAADAKVAQDLFSAADLLSSMNLERVADRLMGAADMLAAQRYQ